MTNHNSSVNVSKDEKIDKWFDSFIEALEIDKLLLKEDLVSNDTKQMYSILMDENLEEMMRLSSSTSKMFFIEALIKEYLIELKSREVKFKKIALDLGASKVLSWVEIENDDEKSEDALFLTEAKLNAKYHNDGFYLSTTIVEERDHIPVPSHYHTLGV